MAKPAFKPTKEQLEKIEASGEDVHEVQVGEGVVLFKCPSELEYRSYIGRLLNDRQRLDAAEKLCSDVVVFPSKSEFSQVVQAFPGVYQRIAAAVAEVADGAEVTMSKKPQSISSAPTKTSL